MKRILLTFFLVCLLQAFARDCNNPLLSVFNLTGLNSPRSGKGLAYCSNLQNNQTCCSNETVSSFQSMLDSQTQGLYDLVAAKDLYLSSLNDKFLSHWSDLSDDINESLNEIGERQFQRLPGSDRLADEVNLFYNISGQLQDIRNEFYWNLRSYQRARTQCVERVLEVQASIWCLACDPNYADNGVSSNGSIAFSDQLCRNISHACYPFLQESVQFNPLLRARRNFQQLLNLSNTLQNYAADSSSDYYYQDYQGYSDYSDYQDCPSMSNNNNDNIPSFDRYYDPISSEEPVNIPQGCTRKNCSWQCRNLFSNNVINYQILASGAGILGNSNQPRANNSNSSANSSNSTANNRTKLNQTTNNRANANQSRANNSDARPNNQTNLNQTIINQTIINPPQNNNSNLTPNLTLEQLVTQAVINQLQANNSNSSNSTVDNPTLDQLVSQTIANQLQANSSNSTANNQTNLNQTLINQTIINPPSNNQTNNNNRNNSSSASNSTNNSSSANNNSNTWTPNLNETGLDINFRSDPGYVFWLLNDRNYEREVESSRRTQGRNEHDRRDRRDGRDGRRRN